MNCPFCKHPDTSVVDSREAENGETIRRRRMCDSCDKRFTTFEKIEGLDLKVIKKDGKREDFNHEKVKRGLIKATWKRPVSLEQIDEIVDDVEAKLRSRGVKEIKSWEIGNLVINRLKKIDKLAYLLFASVYRDFDSLEDFQTELGKLIECNQGDKSQTQDCAP